MINNQKKLVKNIEISDWNTHNSRGNDISTFPRSNKEDRLSAKGTRIQITKGSLQAASSQGENLFRLTLNNVGCWYKNVRCVVKNNHWREVKLKCEEAYQLDWREDEFQCLVLTQLSHKPFEPWLQGLLQGEAGYRIVYCRSVPWFLLTSGPNYSFSLRRVDTVNLNENKTNTMEKGLAQRVPNKSSFRGRTLKKGKYLIECFSKRTT